jgi:hypothetical protein
VRSRLTLDGGRDRFPATSLTRDHPISPTRGVALLLTGDKDLKQVRPSA